MCGTGRPWVRSVFTCSNTMNRSAKLTSIAARSAAVGARTVRHLPASGICLRPRNSQVAVKACMFLLSRCT